MIHFRYPHHFVFFIPYLLILLLYIWSRLKRKKDLALLGEWGVIKQLISIEALKRRKNNDLVALLALFVLFLASTGPQFGARLKEVQQRGIDVFIAIDTSRSMLAEDMIPSRLEHAKRSLGVLIDKLAGNRTGIIAFAKYPIIQCPLTVDSDAARMFLDIVDTNSVPRQGTAIGEAIRLALNSFNYEEKTGKAIVLLTDGEDHESDPMEAAKLAKEKGVTIFTIGIGTTKGEVIKNRDEQGNITAFHKYKGEMVVSRMDDALLTKIATLTGGQYYHASSSDSEIDDIANTLNGFDKKEFSSKIYERLEERYQIFILLVLLLLLWEFFFAENPGQLIRLKAAFSQELVLADIMKRFKKRNLVLVMVLIQLSSLIHADMKASVIKGNQLAKKKDFLGARQQFESAQIDEPDMPLLPYNIGLTYYAEGDFEEAMKQFEKTLAMTKDPKIMAMTHYNMGHVAYAQGNKERAIQEFKECLKHNSSDEDAKYNIEYIRSGKTPQNPPPQAKPQQNKDQKSGQNDKDKNPSQDQTSQGQNNEQEKKPGQLSKDDAERILEMMNDQEKDKLKNAEKFKQGQNNKNKDDNKNAAEDW